MGHLFQTPDPALSSERENLCCPGRHDGESDPRPDRGRTAGSKFDVPQAEGLTFAGIRYQREPNSPRSFAHVANTVDERALQPPPESRWAQLRPGPSPAQHAIRRLAVAFQPGSLAERTTCTPARTGRAVLAVGPDTFWPAGPGPPSPGSTPRPWARVAHPTSPFLPA